MKESFWKDSNLVYVTRDEFCDCILKEYETSVESLMKDERFKECFFRDSRVVDASSRIPRKTSVEDLSKDPVKEVFLLSSLPVNIEILSVEDSEGFRVSCGIKGFEEMKMLISVYGDSSKMVERRVVLKEMVCQSLNSGIENALRFSENPVFSCWTLCSGRCRSDEERDLVWKMLSSFLLRRLNSEDSREVSRGISAMSRIQVCRMMKEEFREKSMSRFVEEFLEVMRCLKDNSSLSNTNEGEYLRLEIFPEAFGMVLQKNSKFCEFSMREDFKVKDFSWISEWYSRVISESKRFRKSCVEKLAECLEDWSNISQNPSLF